VREIGFQRLKSAPVAIPMDDSDGEEALAETD